MNVLINGLGSIAKKHITAIRETAPGTAIYALRSIAGATPYEDVINVQKGASLPVKPDFVIISNPTSLHRQSIEESIAFGCPLFIEKPVLSSTEGADELLRRLEANNILTYVACNLRFHPVLQRLKEYLSDKSPRINEVNIYCGSYLPSWRPGQDYTKSYSASAEMGGGVHLDLIHEIDYAYWLFGKPQDVMSIRRKVSSLQINSVDFAAYHLLYPEFVVNIILNYYRKDAKRTIEVLTEDGTISADLVNGQLSNENNEALRDGPANIAGTYSAQMRYFIENISRQQQPMNSFRESLDVLKIALQ